jgi:O-antigen/teichoic acid export membrane protein
MAAEKLHLKRNFIILLLAQAYSQVLAALSGLLVARFLGPLEYGSYALAVAGLNLGAIVADAGLSAYLGRETARRSVGESLALWRLALQTRLGLSALVWIAAVSLTSLWPRLGQPSLLALAGLTLFPLSVIILTTTFLNGCGRVLLSASLNALIGTLSFGLVLIGLLWQPMVGMVLVTTLIVNLAGALILDQPIRTSPDWADAKGQAALAWWRLLKASRHFLLIGLASLVFQYADTYLVSLLLDTEAVGQYGAALRLLALVTAIPTVWGVAAVPHFARQPDLLRAELGRWGWGLSLSGVGIALVGQILAQPLLSLLLGSRYEVAGHLLGWLLWAGTAIFASAAPVT